MNILLFQEDEEVRHRLSFFLESTYNAVVHEITSPEGALDLLDGAAQRPTLLIIDFNQESVNKYIEVWPKCAGIPALVSRTEGKLVLLPTLHVMASVDAARFTENLIETMDELVKKAALVRGIKDDLFVKIRTRLLLPVGPLKGDIYIRLSAEKFVKLFHQGDVFNKDDLEKYAIRKKIEFLFVKREECVEFARKYRQELENRIQENKTSAGEASSLGIHVHEAVQEITKKIGFTKDVQELAKAQVLLTMKSMGEDWQLGGILKKLQESGGKYISTHSTLCAYLACSIAAHMQWGSDMTFYKLTLASFLHDITLDNQELAQLSTIEEMEAAGSKFTKDEQRAFKDHPITAADMARKMNDVPPDVDTIIRQHHETPTGTGFPRGLNHLYIAPLTAVFLVAHDLAQEFLEFKEDFTIALFLDSVKEKYHNSKFKKILECVEKLDREKFKTASGVS